MELFGVQIPTWALYVVGIGAWLGVVALFVKVAPKPGDHDYWPMD